MPTKYDCGGFIPGNEYDNLTLNISGSTYIAPANGWFYINKVTNGSAQYVAVGNNTTGITYATDKPNTDAWCTILCEAKKGEECFVSYSAGGALNAFKFVYVNGQQSIIKY